MHLPVTQSLNQANCDVFCASENASEWVMNE